jgi:hypothetical protein
MAEKTILSNKRVRVEVINHNDVFRAKIFKKVVFRKLFLKFFIFPWLKSVVKERYIATTTFSQRYNKWDNTIKDHLYEDLISETLGSMWISYVGQTGCIEIDETLCKHDLVEEIKISENESQLYASEFEYGVDDVSIDDIYYEDENLTSDQHFERLFGNSDIDGNQKIDNSTEANEYFFDSEPVSRFKNN